MWILNHWTTSEVPEESVNSPSDHILILNHYHMWLDPDWGAQGGTPRSLELSVCSGKGSRDGRGQEEPGWQTLEVARRVRLLRFKFMLPHLLAVALISLGPNISGPHFRHSGPDNISTAKGWCTPSRNTKFRCCH